MASPSKAPESRDFDRAASSFADISASCREAGAPIDTSEAAVEMRKRRERIESGTETFSAAELALMRAQIYEIAAVAARLESRSLENETLLSSVYATNLKGTIPL